MTKPRMSNHHRGLWGYHGETAAGLELTVQSTGIGGPSAAIVVGELAALGVRTAVRVGSCASLAAGPAAGTGLVIGSAIAADGTSAALGADPGSEVRADADLTEALARALSLEPVTVLSRDLPATEGDLEPASSPPDPPRASVADLQTAAVLVAGRALGVRAAVLLAVASAGGRRLEDEPLEGRLLALADAAVAAVAGSPQVSTSTRG